MTGQPYDEDDAEFDAFLQGKGPLAQGLAELTQPEPSAALDAAILARVAADLGQGGTADVRPAVTAVPTAVEMIAAGTNATATVAPVTMASAVAPSSTTAANDSPADFRPRRWTERWRVPVALAAGVTAISIALPLWQDELAQQQAIQASMQEMQIPAMPAPMAEAHPPPETAAPAPDSAAPAKDAAAPGATPAATGAGRATARPPAVMAIPSGQGAKAEAARNDAVAEKRKADAGEERKAMERELAATREGQQRASQAAPVAEAAPPKVQMPAPVAAPSSAAPPPPSAPAPAYARTPEPIVAPAPALLPQADYRAGAPAQSPPPALAKQLADDAASQPIYPATIVARIEQLLKEGKRDEALAEWERLRTAYPNYPVPDKLREALGR